MPIKKYNVARQRSSGNAITINGLLTWRSRCLRRLRIKDGDEKETLADIAAIDRVLVNVLGFKGDIAALSRDFRREALFGRGELYRAVCDVLRAADKPMTAREIATAVMAGKGRSMTPGRESREWINRVRHVCQKLKGVEVAIGEAGLQVWEIYRP
ncbi:MAG TPA: hypothetical protein PKD55_24585 [Bellilinea sp.]|nr:hypothetical protein [Bellilinea sp.]